MDVETVRWLGVAASVTVKVGVTVPIAVGVPEMAPDEFIVRPAGRPVTDHVYGVVPPPAAMVAEYGTPRTPFGSEVVEITRALLTVTFAVPSVTFVAVARITALPSATPVMGTLMLVAPTPYEAAAGTVAAAVLLELNVTDRPPAGAGAERSKLTLCTLPAPTVTT